MSMMTVEHLAVSYGRPNCLTRVVDDVSFDVGVNETFGLIGESGCGKSTILGALAGRNTHWSGRITINGQAIGVKRTPEQLALQQMVFQDPFGSLHPRHTIGRILQEPLEIHGIGDRQDKVEAVLKDVGLPVNFRYRFPHQLSGGQRQRVAIARALILKPRILLLDEPTSALDVSIQAEILNLLKDLRQREKLTLILVSHDMAVVAHLCDRVAVMQNGVFVETVTKRQILEGTVTHPYTKVLMDGSRGYMPSDRAVARESRVGIEV